MSLHSAPSIVWELSGEPCETRDQALSGIKNNTEAFIICSRGDEFLQAICNSPDNYHYEISFAGGKDRELYMTPPCGAAPRLRTQSLRQFHEMALHFLMQHIK